MSISQITSRSQQSGGQQCTRCGMVIPPTAAFCGKCGERIEKPPQIKETFPTDKHMDLERYRITSLVRRAPCVQLSLAMDTQQQRPVVIRDIDIHQIDIASRPRIFKALQQEYDFLRKQNNTDVLPLIASFHEQDHLYSISTWPSTMPTQKNTSGQASHIYTLQDLLQSGIGLPDEQIALNWILRLANAVEHLHRNQIVIGNLDPSTILVNQKDYSGQPTLFPSWMPPVVRSQMQQVLNTANASSLSHIAADRTDFFSPEARYGLPEMRSDIYSMGAILYLLVTGIAPTEQTSQQLRSPREINPRVQSTLAMTILKALSKDPAVRFQSVNEFIAVLMQQQTHSKVTQRRTLLSYNRSVEKVGTQGAEINFTYTADTETNDDTVSIAPLPKQSVRVYLSRIKTNPLGQEPAKSDRKESIVEKGYLGPGMEPEEERTQESQSAHSATSVESRSEPEDVILLQNVSDDSVSPDENREELQQNRSIHEVFTDHEKRASPGSIPEKLSIPLLPLEVLPQEKRDFPTSTKTLPALFERLKRFVLGNQPRINNAVAIIETPMRIQPNKNYTLRIHIMGRNEPKHARGFKQDNDTTEMGGLGSLTYGERVHIEVRSALYHNYAYIVQQTDVEVPAPNYAAEVTIPMRSIIDGTGTRRERLHIFFTDEKHNPLYEKPFLIELFISNLVQSGQEGHNVLSIPL